MFFLWDLGLGSTVQVQDSGLVLGIEGSQQLMQGTFEEYEEALA